MLPPGAIVPPQSQIALQRAAGVPGRAVPGEQNTASGRQLPLWLQGQELQDLPGVQEGHIAQAFREIDLDGKGFIGVSELRYLLMLHGERPTDEELDEMVRMVDVEGMGKIDYDLFLGLFKPGNAVHAEMVSMAPEEVSFTETVKAKGPPRPRTKQQAKLYMRSAAAFANVEVRKQKQQERKQALPQPKKSAVEGQRARPDEKREPLPVNTAARKERDMAMRKGKGKGEQRQFGEQEGPASYLSPRPAASPARGPAMPDASQEA